MPERLNGAVSKTVDLARDPGVRIPLSPPIPKPAERRFFCFEENQKLVFVFSEKEKNGYEVAGFWGRSPPQRDHEIIPLSPPIRKADILRISLKRNIKRMICI
jgi:hypothetical protein